MTPRSRKPVMLMGTMLSSSDHQTTHQSSFASLREEDEEENTAEAVEESTESNVTVKNVDINDKRETTSSMTSPILSNKFRYYKIYL